MFSVQGRGAAMSRRRAFALVCAGVLVSLACSESSSDIGPETGGTSGGQGSAGEGVGGVGVLGANSEACPELQPEPDSPCEKPVVGCSYACGNGPRSQWECPAGVWLARRSCDAECPAARPAPFSECASLEGLSCPYAEDACGSEQHVVAMCSSGRWLLYGPSDEDASPACQVRHQDGIACELPAGCKTLTCYDVSCYAQPLVEECVDGKWRVQTSCIK